MTTFKVNFTYPDDNPGTTHANLCDAPSMEWVKAWYTFKGKTVFEIHEALEWEVREGSNKGMPWTAVPEPFMMDVINDRIIKVLCDLAEIGEDEDDEILVHRVHEIMDAINEERI